MAVPGPGEVTGCDASSVWGRERDRERLQRAFLCLGGQGLQQKCPVTAHETVCHLARQRVAHPLHALDQSQQDCPSCGRGAARSSQAPGLALCSEATLGLTLFCTHGLCRAEPRTAPGPLAPRPAPPLQRPCREGPSVPVSTASATQGSEVLCPGTSLVTRAPAPREG